MSIIIPPSVPNYGFTHQEMLDIISSELGNVSISTKITAWLNMVIIDIASKYVFGNLHKYGTSNTLPGIPDVTLADDFYWLKTIAIPVQSTKLYPADEQRLSESSPQYRTLVGSVTHYYLNSNILGLWHVPADSLAINYSYQRRPIKLAASAGICDLPFEWHTLVIQKAITKGYSQEGNDTGFSNSLQIEARLFRELQISAYRRLDETFILGGSNTRGRLPRPKLPSNFPRG